MVEVLDSLINGRVFTDFLFKIINVMFCVCFILVVTIIVILSFINN